MCLAVPLKLTKIEGCEATGERDGVVRQIRVDFIENPQIGDYVISHAGFAIEKIAPEMALEQLAAAAEVEREMAAIAKESEKLRDA